MSGPRRITAGDVTRPVLGGVAALAVVAAITGAVLAPWPTLAVAPAAVLVVPEGNQRVAVCAGDLLIAGRDANDAASVTAVAAQSVATAPLALAQARALASDAGGNAPVALSTSAEGQSSAPVFAAAGSASVSAQDIAGFAASACQPPLADAWLVAGSGATGAGDLVLLSNPGDVAATVQLTVYGGSGPQRPPGGTNVIIPAGSQRVIPLAGLALGEESPVIRVQSAGAPVAASLQSSITRTLVPGGVDQTGALAEAASRLSIGGVTVVPVDETGANGAASTAVRLLATAADASATVTVYPVGSPQSVVDSEPVALTAGVPVTLDLPALAVGTYRVEISATTPVVGAVWQTTGFGAGADFAWYLPVPVSAGARLIAVPAGPAPVVTLVNLESSDVTLQLTDALGGVTSVTVPAASSVAVPVQAGTFYALDGGAVAASLSFAGPGALAGYPLWPVDAGAEPLTVYP